MPKEDFIEFEGEVLEALPNAHVFREAGQRPPDSGPYLRETQDELYQDTARRQGDGGDLPLRPDQGQDYMAVQVARRAIGGNKYEGASFRKADL